MEQRTKAEDAKFAEMADEGVFCRIFRSFASPVAESRRRPWRTEILAVIIGKWKNASPPLGVRLAPPRPNCPAQKRIRSFDPKTA